MKKFGTKGAILCQNVKDWYQKLLDGKPKPENGEKNIFSDLLVCADCGKKLWYHTNTVNLVFSQKAVSSYALPDYTYPSNVSKLQYQKSGDAEVRCVDASCYANKGEISQTILRNGTVWSEEVFQVESNLSCTRWLYKRLSDQTDLIAQKDGGIIKLSGTFKGKAQEKTFKIGDGLWYQMMEMAMPAFIASEEKQIVFYSIGTGNNRGAMGLGEFAAEKNGEETITVNGTTYDCVKITFVLTAFSWAWTGLYWYDKQSGQLVQTGEKGKNAEKNGYQLTSMK